MNTRDLMELGVTRLDIARLTVFTLLFTAFEGLGISLLLPVLDYISHDDAILDIATLPVYNHFLNKQDQHGFDYGLIFLLSLALISLILRSFFHYIQDITGVSLALKVSTNLRKNAIDRFLNSNFAFLSKCGSGKLFNALTMEAARAGEAMKAYIVFLTAISLVFVYFILLLWLSPTLVLFIVPAFLLSIIIFRYLRKAMRSLGQRIANLNHTFSCLIGEYLRGMDRVKMRVQEKTASKIIQKTLDDLAASSLSVERWRLLADIGMFPVLVLSSFGVLFVAVEVLGLPLSSLGLFLFILIRMAPQFSTVNGLWSHIQSCRASFQNLQQLIKTAHANQERWSGKIQFESLVDGISCQNLTFSYPNTQREIPALQNFSCFIPKGSLTALVGRSGAGKSTLIKLLVGFHRPQEGNILVDGLSLEKMDIFSWRKIIAYVSQEPFLFNQSIRANLNFGLDHLLSTEQEAEVLRKSYADKFVARLEKGLDEGVGEEGDRLSQGQKQRLAMAHALAVNPQILLLDEPTSALDSESEEAIHTTIKSLRGKLTMVVIAHRLSTIRQADQILLLDEGMLEAQGKHDDLLERSTLYRSLFDRSMVV